MAGSTGQGVQILKLMTQSKIQQGLLVRFGFDPNIKIIQPKLFGLVWVNSVSWLTRTHLHL